MKISVILLCLMLSLSVILSGCKIAVTTPEDSSSQQEQISNDSGSNTPQTPENNNQESDTPENNTPEDSDPEPAPPTAPEISPNIIGIYIPAADGTKNRVRITEFSFTRTPKQDIDCFEILASREDVCAGKSFSGIWNAAWEQHDNTEGTKIGFVIDVSLSGGKNIHKQILRPGDTKDFCEYLEIYMYDDIHQDGGWYTHLEDNDISAETIISSIKLTGGSKIWEVTKISLTAFFYQGDVCFDEHGDYIGEVTETIVISPN